eukprot:353445-Chlamydomonas_euryale.AAC.13
MYHNAQPATAMAVAASCCSDSTAAGVCACANAGCHQNTITRRMHAPQALHAVAPSLTWKKLHGFKLLALLRRRAQVAAMSKTHRHGHPSNLPPPTPKQRGYVPLDALGGRPVGVHRTVHYCLRLPKR